MHFSQKTSCCMIIRVTWARWWLGCLHIHLANIRSHIVTGEPLLSWVGVYALTQVFLFCIMKAKNSQVGPHSALKRGPPHSHVLSLSFLASSTTAYTLPWRETHACILIQVKGLADDVDTLYVKLVNIRWIGWCGIFASLKTFNENSGINLVDMIDYWYSLLAISHSPTDSLNHNYCGLLYSCLPG
jgi:hypothetical protein